MLGLWYLPIPLERSSWVVSRSLLGSAEECHLKRICRPASVALHLEDRKHTPPHDFWGIPDSVGWRPMGGLEDLICWDSHSLGSNGVSRGSRGLGRPLGKLVALYA